MQDSPSAHPDEYSSDPGAPAVALMACGVYNVRYNLRYGIGLVEAEGPALQSGRRWGGAGSGAIGNTRCRRGGSLRAGGERVGRNKHQPVRRG